MRVLGQGLFDVYRWADSLVSYLCKDFLGICHPSLSRVRPYAASCTPPSTLRQSTFCCQDAQLCLLVSTAHDDNLLIPLKSAPLQRYLSSPILSRYSVPLCIPSLAWNRDMIES